MLLLKLVISWWFDFLLLSNFFTLKSIPSIATDANVASSVRLSHSSILLKPMDGIRCHLANKGQRLKVVYSSIGNPSQSYGASPAVWNHSVSTCRPTQVNVPHHNPSKIGLYLIYLPRRNGRLSWPRRLVTYQDGLPARMTITHPSTNPARRRATSLIGYNALSLRHATNYQDMWSQVTVIIWASISRIILCLSVWQCHFASGVMALKK